MKVNFKMMQISNKAVEVRLKNEASPNTDYQIIMTLGMNIKGIDCCKNFTLFGTGSSHRSMMCKVKRVHSWRATLRVTPLLWHWLKTQLFKMRRETRSRYAVLRERSNKSFRWLKLRGRSLLWTWKAAIWLLSRKTIWLRFLTLAEDSINRLVLLANLKWK